MTPTRNHLWTRAIDAPPRLASPYTPPEVPRLARLLGCGSAPNDVGEAVRGRTGAIDDLEERRVAGTRDAPPHHVVREIGQTRWAIAEGYIPGWSHGPQPELLSHETVCILNASDRDAHVAITVFFADREPAGPYRVTVGARRTAHVRFNNLRDPEPIPHDTDYASVIESDVPIVVQHTRLDSRQSENALITTIAYAASE